MSRRAALLVGTSHYTDAKLARLHKPASDARRLAETLKSTDIGAFDDVMTLENPTSAEVRRAVARLFGSKAPDDLLLFYFSGHGMRDDSGDLYLATTDTETDLLSASAIPAGFITGEMDRSRSKSQVIILDCCYSGAFPAGMKGAAGMPVGTASAFQGRGVGRVVLTASDSTQYAWEENEVVGEVVNSVFTHFLVHGLSTGEADLDADGLITIDELYDYVYDKVAAVTPKQTPGKWTYRQQGGIVLARNPTPIITPVPLPQEITTALDNPLANIREAAIRDLVRFLNGTHRGLALSARIAVEYLCKDDSRRVASAAQAALAHLSESHQNTSPLAQRLETAQGSLANDDPRILQRTSTTVRAQEIQNRNPPIQPPASTGTNVDGKTKDSQTQEGISNDAGRTAANWLFGWSIALLPLTAGLSLIGIFGALGMRKGRASGHRAGLVFSLMAEAVGLLVALGAAVALSVESIYDDDWPLYALIGSGLVDLSVGVWLSWLLEHSSVRRVFGIQVDRPRGLLSISVGCLTVGGVLLIVPGILILCRNNVGRRLSLIALGLLGAFVPIAAIGLGLKLQHRVYVDSEYVDQFSPWGFTSYIAIGIVFCFWCVCGVAHLRSSSVRNWFEAEA